jgi:cobalt/nickel transport system ATP-binding protein
MQTRLTDILKNVDKSVIVVSHDKEFIELVVDKVYKVTPNGLELAANLSEEYVHAHDGLPPHSHPHEH